ncbi:hypothetical protein Q7P35_001691 [Cladosporium inversicolor]
MDSLQCLGLILDPNWEQPSVDYPYDGQIDVGHLQEYAQSIEYLRLEDSDATWLTYESSNQAAQFYNFFEHASNLKQLALSGPAIDNKNEVAEFLDIIKPLTALRIFKTQMFFVDDDIPGGSNPNIPSADLLLAAVVITVSGLPSQLFEEKTFAFLRLEQIGPDCGKTFVAVKIEPHMVKHHVTCADILEEETFVLDGEIIAEPCTACKAKMKAMVGLGDRSGKHGGIDLCGRGD